MSHQIEAYRIYDLLSKRGPLPLMTIAQELDASPEAVKTSISEVLEADIFIQVLPPVKLGVVRKVWSIAA